MKTTGIILLAIGAFSFLGSLVALSQGRMIMGGPLFFIVLGAFLISQANKKEEKEKKKKQWADDKLKDE